MPAGVAHKNEGSGKNFKCIGAYPKGTNYDMNYGKPKERPDADNNIRKLPLPENDPVFGKSRGVVVEWRK